MRDEATEGEIALPGAEDDGLRVMSGIPIDKPAPVPLRRAPPVGVGLSSSSARAVDLPLSLFAEVIHTLLKSSTKARRRP